MKKLVIIVVAIMAVVNSASAKGENIYGISYWKIMLDSTVCANAMKYNAYADNTDSEKLNYFVEKVIEEPFQRMMDELKNPNTAFRWRDRDCAIKDFKRKVDFVTTTKKGRFFLLKAVIESVVRHTYEKSIIEGANAYNVDTIYAFLTNVKEIFIETKELYKMDKFGVSNIYRGIDAQFELIRDYIDGKYDKGLFHHFIKDYYKIKKDVKIILDDLFKDKYIVYKEAGIKYLSSQIAYNCCFGPIRKSYDDLYCDIKRSVENNKIEKRLDNSLKMELEEFKRFDSLTQ